MPTRRTTEVERIWSKYKQQQHRRHIPSAETVHPKTGFLSVFLYFLSQCLEVIMLDLQVKFWCFAPQPDMSQLSRDDVFLIFLDN